MRHGAVSVEAVDHVTAVERAVVIHRLVRLFVKHDVTWRETEVVVVELVLRQLVGDVMRVDLDQAWYVFAVAEHLKQSTPRNTKMN